MEAVLLSQGNEVTSGLTLDTNSHWLCGQLWELGIPVRRIITVPDRLDDLVEVLQQAAQLAPLVIGTGGLGPTRDDLTAQAVARAFDRDLEMNQEALSQVEAIYDKWGRPMADSNRKQAELPVGAQVLENRWGTAPGFSVEVKQGHGDSTTLYFIPGVPREMRPMFKARVRPDILDRHELRPLTVHTVRVIGVPESELEMTLRKLDVPGLGSKDLEVGFRARLPENHIKLAFAPSVSEKLRQRTIAAVRELVGPRAYGVDSGDLSQVVGEMLAEAGQTLALAESCTAGRLACGSSVPGASRYLLEGAVVYSNAAKLRTCGVTEESLREHGAVSEAVARQLARGIRERARSTWELASPASPAPPAERMKSQLEPFTSPSQAQEAPLTGATDFPGIGIGSRG